jgi:hypothetical protein
MLARVVSANTVDPGPTGANDLDKKKLFVELNRILDDLETLRESAFEIQRRIEKLKERLEVQRSNRRRSPATHTAPKKRMSLPRLGYGGASNRFC